jgi:hypothetical protein
MESLESKLDRLSSEQRKEIEDFVDFLLSRSGPVCIPPDVTRNPPPVLNMAPPPFTLIEPMVAVEMRPWRLPDAASSDERAAPAAGEEQVPPPFQEIGGGIQERTTHDYMDYGQFEKQPSLAIEAVQKSRRTIIAREGTEKPRHLLDWVD